MSVNPPDISAPLLLLAPPHWQAALHGQFSATSLIFDLHPQGGTDASPENCRPLQDFLQRRDASSADRPTLVRIGSLQKDVAERDLALFETALPDGILLSGCRNAADIQKLDVLLSVIEASRQVPLGMTTIFAECGAEAEFFLSPYSLAGKSKRLRGLVFNRVALGESTGSAIGNPTDGQAGSPLSFARAVCVLKAAEARVPCYEMLSPEIGPVDLLKARATSKANGFTEIVVSGPAHLSTLAADTTIV